MKLLRKIFDHEYKELKRFEALADKIMDLDEEYSKLTDTELQSKTEEFKRRYFSRSFRNSKRSIIPCIRRKTLLCTDIRWFSNSLW